MNIEKNIGGSEIVFAKNVFEHVPGWHDFEDIFDAALANDKVTFQSFGTMSIDKSETMTAVFDHITAFAKTIHPGSPAAVLSIIHFENSENNHIGDEVLSLYSKFRDHNPQPVPPDFTPSMMVPTIHADPVDGFYVQCTGSTLWTAYYADGQASWLTEPGDALYIPKGVQHSVKTLEPRAAISVGLV